MAKIWTEVWFLFFWLTVYNPRGCGDQNLGMWDPTCIPEYVESSCSGWLTDGFDGLVVLAKVKRGHQLYRKERLKQGQTGSNKPFPSIYHTRPANTVTQVFQDRQQSAGWTEHRPTSQSRTSGVAWKIFRRANRAWQLGKWGHRYWQLEDVKELGKVSGVVSSAIQVMEQLR